LNIRTWRIFRDTLTQRLERIPDVSPNQPNDWFETWQVLDDLSREFFHIHRWSVLWAEYAWRAFSIITKVLPKTKRKQLQDAMMASLNLPTAQANETLLAFMHKPDAANKQKIVDQFGSRSASLDYCSPTWADLVEKEDGLSAYQVTKVADSKKDMPALSFWVRFLSYPLRRWLEMREEQRFYWERILARQRRMLLEAGELLAEKRNLHDGEDVFWLEWKELCAALQGNPTEALQRCIQLRKHQHVIEALMPKPLFLGPDVAARPASADFLGGIGASAGITEGRAAILRHPREFNPAKHRDCIVVLPALDPAWSPLLPQARGWVIERGGILSHAAILAREYRVPLVIGVEDACHHIPEGTPLRMDGEKGELIVDKKGVRL
jgi:phosphohistidine swiveling domain-containing protein